MKNKMFLKIMNLKDDKMDLLDVMLKRRSVRKYTDEEIPNEKMNRIIQAGLLAPTSRNLKPCNFSKKFLSWSLLFLKLSMIT